MVITTNSDLTVTMSSDFIVGANPLTDMEKEAELAELLVRYQQEERISTEVFKRLLKIIQINKVDKEKANAAKDISTLDTLITRENEAKEVMQKVVETLKITAATIKQLESRLSAADKAKKASLRKAEKRRLLKEEEEKAKEAEIAAAAAAQAEKERLQKEEEEKAKDAEIVAAAAAAAEAEKERLQKEEAAEMQRAAAAAAAAAAEAIADAATAATAEAAAIESQEAVAVSAAAAEKAKEEDESCKENENELKMKDSDEKTTLVKKESEKQASHDKGKIDGKLLIPSFPHPQTTPLPPPGTSREKDQPTMTAPNNRSHVTKVGREVKRESPSEVVDGDKERVSNETLRLEQEGFILSMFRDDSSIQIQMGMTNQLNASLSFLSLGFHFSILVCLLMYMLLWVMMMMLIERVISVIKWRPPSKDITLIKATPVKDVIRATKLYGKREDVQSLSKVFGLNKLYANELQHVWWYFRWRFKMIASNVSYLEQLLKFGFV